MSLVKQKNLSFWMRAVVDNFNEYYIPRAIMKAKVSQMNSDRFKKHLILPFTHISSQSVNLCAKTGLCDTQIFER